MHLNTPELQPRNRHAHALASFWLVPSMPCHVSGHTGGREFKFNLLIIVLSWLLAALRLLHGAECYIRWQLFYFSWPSAPGWSRTTCASRVWRKVREHVHVSCFFSQKSPLFLLSFPYYVHFRMVSERKSWRKDAAAREADTFHRQTANNWNSVPPFRNWFSDHRTTGLALCGFLPLAQ